jgi:predicted DNA-binding transcriptional regulator AlpA
MELKLDEVLKMTGMSVDYIYRKEKNGDFPKRFKIDRWHVRWHERAVKEWIKKHQVR